MPQNTLTLFYLSLIIIILAACNNSDAASDDIPKSNEETTEANASVFGEISSNDDWEIVSQTFDNVEMVLVPPGCFIMGTDSGHQMDGPPHEQCIGSPFWIDQYEVTNEQYGSSVIWDNPQNPRASITYYEALSHCESRGANLPTELQWEYAARGVDNLTYPWGNTFDTSYSANNVSGIDPVPVGSYDINRSWVGAYDMSGNLWEWTTSLYIPYPYSSESSEILPHPEDVLTVLRGGSFAEVDLTSGKSTSRYPDTPTHLHLNNGFRCVREFTESDLN